MSRIKIDQNKVKLNACAINEAERSQLRSAAGQLLWAATQSRPDIAYGTCIASNSYASGTIKDLKLVNKTIVFMQKNPLSIRFPSLDLQHTTMVGFSDASFGNLADGSSQGGHLVLMVDRSGQCCPLTWQSRKIKKVCKSTLAAESWALVEGLESAELIKAQWNEIVKIDVPIVCITDCKSLFDAVKTTNTLEDKGLRIPMACLRQRFNRNEVRYVWVPTNLQLADCLTKAGASSSLLREVLEKGKLPSELSQYSEL